MKEQRYIGVDLGGTNIAVGVVTEDGTILHKKSVPTGAQRPFTEIAADNLKMSAKNIKIVEVK